MGGRPPFLQDFHRQKCRNATVCHFLTVASCIRWARYSHRSRHFERTTQSSRKPGVNRGRGRFFATISCLQAASWLSAARSLAPARPWGRRQPTETSWHSGPLRPHRPARDARLSAGFLCHSCREDNTINRVWQVHVSPAMIRTTEFLAWTL